MHQIQNLLNEIKEIIFHWYTVSIRFNTQRCLNANCMDFDDLLMNTYRLFKEHEAIRQKYANLFSYILVDEYQDTNSVQQQIVSLLTKENNIFVLLEMMRKVSMVSVVLTSITYLISRKFIPIQNSLNLNKTIVQHRILFKRQMD